MSRPSAFLPVASETNPVDVNLVAPGWIATPEEAAAIEEAERQRVARGVADIGAWDRRCRCCAQGGHISPLTGLCPDCDVVVATLEAEQAGAHQINGHTRRQLAERYIETRTP
jgi:hypothetical protein